MYFFGDRHQQAQVRTAPSSPWPAGPASAGDGNLQQGHVNGNGPLLHIGVVTVVLLELVRQFPQAAAGRRSCAPAHLFVWAQQTGYGRFPEIDPDRKSSGVHPLGPTLMPRQGLGPKRLSFPGPVAHRRCQQFCWAALSCCLARKAAEGQEGRPPPWSCRQVLLATGLLKPLF